MSVPPATQNPCTLPTTGLPAVEQAREDGGVAAHHRVVHRRVPRLARVVVRGDHRRVDRRPLGPPPSADPLASAVPSALSTRSYPPQNPVPCRSARSTRRSGPGRHARRSRRARRAAARVIPLPRSGRSSIIRATRSRPRSSTAAARSQWHPRFPHRAGRWPGTPSAHAGALQAGPGAFTGGIPSDPQRSRLLAPVRRCRRPPEHCGQSANSMSPSTHHAVA